MTKRLGAPLLVALVGLMAGQNATASNVWNSSELSNLMETNRRKFVGRWGDLLRARGG